MSILEGIIKTAKEAGASDIHIAAGMQPKMRVNGELCWMNYKTVEPNDTTDIILQLMSGVQRECFEACGECDMTFSLPQLGRYRMNGYRQQGTTAMTFRLLDDLEELVRKTKIPEAVKKLCEYRQGLILVSGADGSGKTTTLAAMLNEINEKQAVHIVTIEKPIEYLHKAKCAMISQREVGIDTQSYAAAVRAARKEDADVIALGELCDYETLQEVIAAAENGHLVLASLPAGEASSAAETILDMVPVEKQRYYKMRLEKALLAVIFQRLDAADKKNAEVLFEVLSGKEAF